MTKTITIFMCILNLTILWLKSTIGNEIIYSLVTDLEPLLQTQKQVIVDLRRCVADKKKTYAFIRREYLRFKSEHDKSKTDMKLFLDNKINRFTLIKRLAYDLDYINNITTQEKRLIMNKTLKFPTFEDLEEAVRMIIRLQRVYLLNITQLADGLLETSFSGDETNYSEAFLPMTASDCFEIGKVLYKQKWIKDGIEWLVEALRLCDSEKHTPDVNKVDILHTISKGYNKLNNSVQYVAWTKRLLELKPDFDEDTITDLEVMVDIHQLHINQAAHKSNLKEGGRNTKKRHKKKKKKLSKEKKQRKVFRKLCRNEMVVGHDVSKRLKCWYFKGLHPFSRLAPFKAEQLFIRPDILLIHNAISDAEIKTIKDIALPQLKIIPTRHEGNGSTMHINLSKRMVFNDLESQSVKQVTRRVSDLTGLMADLHSLAVSNYGVGGHYVSHLDSSDWLDRKTLINELKSKSTSQRVNNKKINAYIKYMSQFFRISSVLFYMSNVEQGGATVFPLLGLSVFPIKGAALVWSNLLPSGKADLLTLHAACPVLRGSKWVATKWIDGTNQELRKPCYKNYTSRDLTSIKPVFKKSLHLL